MAGLVEPGGELGQLAADRRPPGAGDRGGRGELTGFELAATCRAPAVEVFKLLHDSSRFPDWWAGMERVESDGERIARYTSEWPDFASLTSV